MQLAVIIRCSGEPTCELLKRQILYQLRQDEVCEIISGSPYFEKALLESYKLAIRLEAPFTVIIDGDILIGFNFLHEIRTLVSKVDDFRLFGFGVKVFDKFYAKPKFRGIHVYRTELLKKAIELIPSPGMMCRPESFVKERMVDYGYKWDNLLCNKVLGIHDFFQRPVDLGMKYYMRFYRSKDDITFLKSKLFIKSWYSVSHKSALQGLRLAENDTNFTCLNNKQLFVKKYGNKFVYVDHIQSFILGVMKFIKPPYLSVIVSIFIAVLSFKFFIYKRIKLCLRRF